MSTEPISSIFKIIEQETDQIKYLMNPRSFISGRNKHFLYIGRLDGKRPETGSNNFKLE
jgi:hypothetical protein